MKLHRTNTAALAVAGLLALGIPAARADSQCGSKNMDTAAVPARNIVETAVEAGKFNTLAAALKAAGLVETLEGAGPFTVFAPTDDAFAKLPAGTLDALLADKARLTAVLTYHVVPGKLMAADVVRLQDARTVQGQSVKIDAGKVVKVDEATIVQADVNASNGVIHVIDTVILPN